MKSKANIKGHPIHPMIIPFPIAFFSGALFFDIAATIRHNENLSTVAYYLTLGGLGFAVLAAVPGIIDFVYRVPPKSSAKKRAARHGLTNALVVFIFLGACFYRRDGDSLPFILIGLEVVAVALMVYAGWMGGTLVFRNQIGVDHRYANAGKWNEQYLTSAESLTRVADSDELKVNAMKLIHIGQQRIVLARTEDKFVAFDDRCTHKGGSLAGGSIMCGVVQCPWHGAQFNVDSGLVKQGPAKEKIHTYRVIEKDGGVFLSLEGNK